MITFGFETYSSLPIAEIKITGYKPIKKNNKIVSYLYELYIRYTDNYEKIIKGVPKRIVEEFYKKSGLKPPNKINNNCYFEISDPFYEKYSRSTEPYQEVKGAFGEKYIYDEKEFALMN